LRLTGVDDLGSVELGPIVIAGVWFGGVGAYAAGAAGSALLLIAELVEPQFPFLAVIPRVVILVGGR